MALVRFVGENLEVSVPVGSSILCAAKMCGAPLGFACGGVGACSTCHVTVRAGSEFLDEKEEREDDVLDKAFDVRESSRLGCQACVVVEGVVEVEITQESRKAWEDEQG